MNRAGEPGRWRGEGGPDCRCVRSCQRSEEGGEGEVFEGEAGALFAGSANEVRHQAVATTGADLTSTLLSYHSGTRTLHKHCATRAVSPLVSTMSGRR